MKFATKKSLHLSATTKTGKRYSVFLRHCMLSFMLVSLSACSSMPSGQATGSGLNSLESPDVFTLSQQAQRAYTESRLIEAVQLYQKVIERVPEDANAWFRLGNVYAQQGAYERAIHAYETSLVNDSQQPKTWFNLSTAYLLNAQFAMRQSYQSMRSNDPARNLLRSRLDAVSELLNGRLDQSFTAGLRTAR